MKLIPDARRAWRFGSVQVAALLALLSGIQAEVLPLVSPLFPAPVWPWVSGGLALAVVVLRLVAQPGLVPDSHRAMVEQFYQNNDEFRRDMTEMGLLGGGDAPVPDGTAMAEQPQWQRLNGVDSEADVRAWTSDQMEREDRLGAMLFWGIAIVLCLLAFLIVGLYRAAP